MIQRRGSCGISTDMLLSRSRVAVMVSPESDFVEMSCMVMPPELWPVSRICILV